MPVPRRVLVHYHIYKNAGSTIERQLWESFGDAFALCEGSGDTENIDAATLARHLKANPHLKAVSSHRARPPLPIPGALPVVLLRHPADRAYSAYRFARRNDQMPDHDVASTGSFRDYVAWSLSTRGHGAMLRNQQVTHLSRAAFRTLEDPDDAPNRQDLGEVLALLDAWPAFGIVRRFGESCRLFNARYRPLLPAFHLQDTVENATGAHELNDKAAIEQVADELGGEQYVALCRANLLDIALYQEAVRLFEAKLALSDDAVSKVGWRLAFAAGRVRQKISQPKGPKRRAPGEEAVEPNRL